MMLQDTLYRQVSGQTIQQHYFMIQTADAMLPSMMIASSRSQAQRDNGLPPSLQVGDATTLKDMCSATSGSGFSSTHIRSQQYQAVSR